jgi:hypothetical protein
MKFKINDFVCPIGYAEDAQQTLASLDKLDRSEREYETEVFKRYYSHVVVRVVYTDEPNSIVLACRPDSVVIREDPDRLELLWRPKFIKGQSVLYKTRDGNHTLAYIDCAVIPVPLKLQQQYFLKGKGLVGYAESELQQG